jgi:hypothetical protein
MLRILGRWIVIGRFAGDQAVVAPDRYAVAPPIQREGPARQWLARIPLALAVMQKPARREAVAQAPDQLVRALPFGRADRRRIPFGRLIVVDRHERRLAAHGQAYVLREEIGIDLFAECIERVPGLFGKRHGDARMFGDPLDAHVKREVDFTRLDQAADRRRRAIVRRGCDRQMTFAAKEARGGIEPDPAGAGQVHFGPGVQIGEVVLGAGGAFERLDVGPQLDEIT